MKKRIIVLIAFISVLFSYSLNAYQFNQIVFFGDSLSDDGNLYQLMLKLFPKSPPYYQGRFSNGPTWAENVGAYFYQSNLMGYKNYSYGGATAVFHLPTTKFLAPMTLELEIDKYLIESIFRDKTKTLYAIWIGGNDYYSYTDSDPENLTEQVVGNIVWAISVLKRHGAANFLILNLPDLSQTPYGKASGQRDKLRTFSDLHNTKLQSALEKLEITYPEIKIYKLNIDAMYKEIMIDPRKYNEKYHTNIVNITDSCWTGGYTLQNMMQANSVPINVQNEIQSAISNDKGAANNYDSNQVSQSIFTNPDLAYTYNMGKAYENGMMPCANAQEFLFWDALHPTEAVHKVLGQMVVELLSNTVTK